MKSVCQIVTKIQVVASILVIAAQKVKANLSDIMHPARDPVGTGCTTDSHHNQASLNASVSDRTQLEAVSPLDRRLPVYSTTPQPHKVRSVPPKCIL